MDIPPVHSLNLSGVLSVSKRILTVNSGHFLALSLFFLPLSFSFIFYASLRISGHHFHQFPPNQQKALISQLVYILITHVLSLCAIATVTYSTYHAFLGTPAKSLGAIKSLAFSFFPILSTAIVAHILLFLISLTFLLFIGAIVMLGQRLGFVIDYDSIYFTSAVGVTLFIILIYFYVNWSLAIAIVVAESKWGFAPLGRSSYLVKGMRSVSLLLLLYFGLLGSALVWVCGNTDSWYLRSSTTWGFVLLTTIGVFFVMMILVQSIIGNTVLYMYCKALHGELAIDIADHDHGYIHLPWDDENEKVPNVAAA